MSITLRGHHLLCIHGFQGMGYSPEFIRKMGQIVSDVKDREKNFDIRVVASLDEACMTCPHHGVNKCESSIGADERIVAMDDRVLSHIGIKPNESYDKQSLIQLTAERVNPNDLDVLCRDCSWLSYGVCKSGISELQKSFNNLTSSQKEKTNL
ncbi:DUF1284 domain-containing protein [Bacillus sp. FJAT-45350]|uniref:DUF1284 domain-containing protein n=1 Tax=Bacillus sp. FJAT-45350 TaxID=2011014 RepID=UPI000BB8AB61|nr:DUF1284 domain-containing protein [Bacillus sp. FJAT-45350]